MIKKHKVLFLVIVCILAALGHSAEKNLVNKLNLSRTQVKQIQAQEQIHNRERAQIREQLQLKEKELKTELAKSEPDQNRIRAITQELNQLRAKQLDNQVNGILATKKVMNKEQLKELEKLQEQNRLGQTNQYQYKKGAQQGNADAGKRGK